MYQILARSDERNARAEPLPRAIEGPEDGLIVHMEQNRSSFPQEARGALSVLVTLLMATSILPALEGRWLVPLFSLGVMALMVWVLERHRKQPPFSERLELADGQVRYTNSAGRAFALTSHWVRFEAERRTPCDVRLLLHNRHHQFEVGTSLSLDERVALAPLLASALLSAKGG